MKTKTRSSTLSMPASLRRAWIDEGPSTGTLYFQSASNAQNTTVLDETITYDEPKKKYQGNCVHTRVHRSLAPMYATYRKKYNNNPASSYLKYEEQEWFWTTYFWTDCGSVRTPTIRTVVWKDLSASAMEAVLPTFSEGGESIVNFMLELKQLGGLFTLWKKSESLLRNIANGHLNVSFGWLPFISDVRRLRDSLANFQKKLRKLQEESGKPQWRHYRRPMDTVDLPPVISLNKGNLIDGYGACTLTRQCKWITRPQYCATIGYTYYLPDMTETSNKIKGYLDSLGIQGNPSIFWNAVPYSFVVDWFFNVGSWLNSLRVDNLSIPATVTDFCHSIKYEWEDQTDLALGDGRNLPLSKIQSLRYERRRDVPSLGRFDSTVKAPNWKQVLLGASLLVQRS